MSADFTNHYSSHVFPHALGGSTLTDGTQATLWGLPGLDKTTFYAAALYLHVAAKGQLRDSDFHEEPRESQTPQAFRDFLDRLADCFARSKSKDAQAHVSATAMVLDRGARKMTIYVTKNVSGKNLDVPACEPSTAAPVVVNEDRDFAGQLCRWFNDLSAGEASRATEVTLGGPRGSAWDGMRRYNIRRLEYYMHKIADWKDVGLPYKYSLVAEDGPILTHMQKKQNEAWAIVSPVIKACREIAKSTPGRPGGVPDKQLMLDSCARAASESRSKAEFRESINEADKILNEDTAPGKLREVGMSTKQEQGFCRVLKWIDYLGRLGDTYSVFHTFCTAPERRGYSYEIEVLDSPTEKSWDVGLYKNTIDAWIGALGLDTQRNNNRRTIREVLADFVSTRGSRGTARVHCEIQLAHHFALPDSPRPLDYIGCSKKSCWLCWQLLGHHGRFTTKGTHRMIYPMWAYPDGFPPAELELARALAATHRDMVSMIQDKALLKRDFSSRQNITHTSRRQPDGQFEETIPSTVGSSSTVDTASTARTTHTEEMSRSYIDHLASLRDGSVYSAPMHEGFRNVRFGGFNSVPCIRFPAPGDGPGGQDPTPRVEEVDFYRSVWTTEGSAYHPGVLGRLSGAQLEYVTAMFSFELEHIEGPRILPNLIFKLPREHIERIRWESIALPDIETSSYRKTYLYMFRMGGGLPKNPWLLKHTPNGKYLADSDLIPWCGDVYVCALESRLVDEDTERFTPKTLVFEEGQLDIARGVEIILNKISWAPLFGGAVAARVRRKLSLILAATEDY